MVDDTAPRPVGAADLETPPADAGFRPAEPLKDAGVAFEADTAPAANDAADTGRAAEAKQLVRDNAAKLQEQAADRARGFAEQGKQRAEGALGQLARALDDAAGQVDEKLGAQYGNYARQAAGQVSGYADSLAAKDVDELVEGLRSFVRNSPAAALGIAAALGFAVARVAQAGLDDRA